ncbi:MAG: hypothetical protein KDI17_18925 [Halioglobus sp.]|nr:hypothetical protein [Halioglobus sp.]
MNNSEVREIWTDNTHSGGRFLSPLYIFIAIASFVIFGFCSLQAVASWEEMGSGKYALIGTGLVFLFSSAVHAAMVYNFGKRVRAIVEDPSGRIGLIFWRGGNRIDEYLFSMSDIQEIRESGAPSDVQSYLASLPREPESYIIKLRDGKTFLVAGNDVNVARFFEQVGLERPH